MENVNIHVGRDGAANSLQVGQSRDEDERDDEPAPAPVSRHSSVSASMLLTRAIGVIFPLVAIIIFVFSMGNMACDQGNAPAAFCSVLHSITGK